VRGVAWLAGSAQVTAAVEDQNRRAATVFAYARPEYDLYTGFLETDRERALT
jgi:hypothetical protein